MKRMEQNLRTRTINSLEAANDIREDIEIRCTTSCVRSEYTKKRHSVSLDLSKKRSQSKGVTNEQKRTYINPISGLYCAKWSSVSEARGEGRILASSTAPH